MKSDNYYEKIISKKISEVEKNINKVFINKKPKSLYEPASYILESKGKKLRPLLVLFSAKVIGGEKINPINAASAVELLHNFTLVHDDIMDNADKRRGKPTVHIKYDVNTAILSGDVLLAVAYESLLKDCKKNAGEIVETFTNGLIEVCEGQSLDKEFELKEKVTLNEYLLMIQKKTAAMLSICCSIGARIGGGSAKEIKYLFDFGLNLGIAFQIQDDILDIIGEENNFGKKVGGDLIEGKKTYPFLRAFEFAVKNNLKSEHDDLLKIIKNKGIKESEVNYYKNIYSKLGIFEDSEKKINYYTKKALSNLENIKNSESKSLLIYLANSLIKRNK